MPAKVCRQCGQAIFSGHVVDKMDGDPVRYYCQDCFAEKYSLEEQTKMYQNEEQYFTSFEDGDGPERIMLGLDATKKVAELGEDPFKIAGDVVKLLEVNPRAHLLQYDPDTKKTVTSLNYDYSKRYITFFLSFRETEMEGENPVLFIT